MPDGIRRLDRIDLISVDVVPPSRCSSCKAGMVAASSTHWRCVTRGCEMFGKPLHTGVYPIESRRDRYDFESERYKIHMDANEMDTFDRCTPSDPPKMQKLFLRLSKHMRDGGVLSIKRSQAKKIVFFFMRKPHSVDARYIERKLRRVVRKVATSRDWQVPQWTLNSFWKNRRRRP